MHVSYAHVGVCTRVALDKLIYIHPFVLKNMYDGVSTDDRQILEKVPHCISWYYHLTLSVGLVFGNHA